MRKKIRSAIQSGHSSVINGIDADKATDAVEKLFKLEIEDIIVVLDELADELSINTGELYVGVCIRDFGDKLMYKYNIQG
jgi:hypothetical protein